MHGTSGKDSEQERHGGRLRGRSESSDWGNRRGRTVAGMTILTGELVSQGTTPVHVGASHSSRDGWDLQQPGPDESPSPEKDEALLGQVPVPPNQIPADGGVMEWKGRNDPDDLGALSSIQLVRKIGADLMYPAARNYWHIGER